MTSYNVCRRRDDDSREKTEEKSKDEGKRDTREARKDSNRTRTTSKTTRNRSRSRDNDSEQEDARYVLQDGGKFVNIIISSSVCRNYFCKIFVCFHQLEV